MRKLSPRFWKILLVVGALLATSLIAGAIWIRASTEASLERMQAQQQAERQLHLAALKRAIDEGPDPFTRQIGIFISTDVINDALSVFAGFEQEIPRRPDLIVRVTSVRCEFIDATPEIEVDATLREKRSGASIQVVGQAYLHLTTREDDPTILQAQVRVVDFLPKARWSWLQLGIGGLLKDYLQIEAADRLVALPTIELPLTRAIETEVPAAERLVKLPVEGKLEAALTFPKVPISFDVRLRHTLFLNHGAYLAFDLK